MQIKPASDCTYDILSLGEVMLRLDPGDGRIRTTRQFQAWKAAANTMLLAVCDVVLSSVRRWCRRLLTMKSDDYLKI